MIRAAYRRLLNERQRNRLRSFARKLRATSYYGDKYYCVLCNRHYKSFLSKGSVDRRPNAECPGCGSLERTRLLYYFLRDETDIFERSISVLHFAPEDCLKSILSGLDIDYTDADINPFLADNVIDITKIDFPSDRFDLIICSHVLGHVPDESAALGELRRVLKPGGQALILTWQGPHEETITREESYRSEYRAMFEADATLQRLHGTAFIETLERHGFDVKRIDYRSKFNTEEQVRYALGDGKRELVFRCSPDFNDSATLGPELKEHV